MHDCHIKNASIVDGTGAAPRKGSIAIAEGKIAAVGKVAGRAKETIDADGAYATPGWVDVHTHYDGQVSWDDALNPSFSHGVTSIVMGNCGVGFAPCPPGGEGRLVELMEGVEDIPGTALHEGIEWGNWETFPEYIDYLAGRAFSMDVGTQVPHSAVRNYVMGERALRHEDATQADLAAMGRIVQEGLKAGALGFSTSRTVGHRSVSGEPIPGTFAEKAELLAIGRAMQAVGLGVFQAVPAGVVGDIAGPEKWTTEQEVELFAEVARASGRKCTFTLVQNGNRPEQWRNCLKNRGTGQRHRPGHPPAGGQPAHRLRHQPALLPHVSTPGDLPEAGRLALRGAVGADAQAGGEGGHPQGSGRAAGATRRHGQRLRPLGHGRAGHVPH